ncbi:MAG: hypothetical protein L0G70_06200 [Rubrobacter sp.]|nr:hypothetical protein [Rubrobacter sp.]
MSTEEFSAYQVRHMLLAIRNWLRSEDEYATDGGYVTIDADAVESLGSGLALDKPSSHRLTLALVDEGYLDGEYVASDSNVTPLRHIQIRGVTQKALGEMG